MFEVRRGKENIAGTRAEEGRYPNGAMADYTQAIKLDPKGVGAYLGRGNVRYVKGNLNGAMADYNQAIRLNPQFAAAYNNRGNVKERKRDLNGAMADYNQAIKLNPQ
jgi:tetratricopeptide (TPR) repeat protein